MVAALIMGIAVAGVLAGLAGAARNAARLTNYDRATVVAKEKMDELLADRDAPRNQQIEGAVDASVAGETKMGWLARVSPFEKLQGFGGWGVDRIRARSVVDGRRNAPQPQPGRFPPEHHAPRRGSPVTPTVTSDPVICSCPARHGERGVTLVELMVAVSITAVITLGSVIRAAHQHHCV